MSNTIGSPQFPGIKEKPGESHAGVPLVSTSTPHPAIMPLNPFNVPNDDFISCNISPFHDVQAIRHDVDSLFNVLSDIVISTSTDSLDFQQVTIDLGQHKVPQVALQPAYSLLNEIACQMTCHSFNTSNVHESVVGILQKLRSYAWDAKTVIALSAFALNYGKPLRLTVAEEASQKENALELHVLTLAKEENKPAQSGSNLTSNLVKITLELIKKIITLEKLFANKSYTIKHFPTLCKDHRAVYAYWAIFSLFACANQTKREEIQYLVLLEKLNVILEEIRIQQGALEDLIWRLEAFQNPSPGIWQLLKALIYPNNVDKPDNIIANNATKELLNLDELITTEKLFLFISGLDIDLEIITSLTWIHDYKIGKIVWVPVVEDWTLEINKERFQYLKSRMPSWYVVEYLSLIEGYEPLQQVWNYRGKPIVVVADAYGNVLNQNALRPIILWGIEVFPFDYATISYFVSQQWKWFWPAAFKIHPPIQTWVTRLKQLFRYYYFHFSIGLFLITLFYKDRIPTPFFHCPAVLYIAAASSLILLCVITHHSLPWSSVLLVAVAIAISVAFTGTGGFTIPGVYSR
ncbi:protein SIEVE ELEMENT OCCLUSION B-like isoform X2 [Arachis ipaensis]|uniref:protein SIEVE ELEMENT OCCLUSION B-like isoform X2 n=1 Tax=Arachis ipaensis TaxID=130454 RepID=UPI000A2B5C30|nr:protein SIEVE ELEMENT OCCLUSION B-like isoform X2 [Arachis ipaensis]